MNNPIHLVDRIPLRRLAWLLPTALAMHEIEEWNIRLWYEKYWKNIPVLDDSSLRSFLVFAIAGGFCGTFLATRFRRDRNFALAVLVFFVLLPFSNAIQHAYWVIAFRAYSPGVITAVMLEIPIILYMAHRIAAERLIQPRLVAAFFLPTVAVLAWTVQKGNDGSGVERIVRFGRLVHEAFF